jgi:hypothetical protein
MEQIHINHSAGGDVIRKRLIVNVASRVSRACVFHCIKLLTLITKSSKKPDQKYSTYYTDSTPNTLVYVSYSKFCLLRYLNIGTDSVYML